MLTAAVLCTVLAAGAYWVRSSRVSPDPVIAFIPQAAGALLWDVERVGATLAAEQHRYHIYWTAPTSEIDVAGQISLIDKVVLGRYHGLVVVPNHPLAILAPLRRAVAAGLPLVIASSPLDFPVTGKVAFIVNDDEKMGEIAAAEVARLIHGRGSIVLIGLSRYAPGIKLRAQSAERFLARNYPDIRVVSRLSGAYDGSHAEEVASGAVDANSGLSAILSLTAASTRGAHAVLKGRSVENSIFLVGCEQDVDLIRHLRAGEVAALAAENTYRMGFDAVGLIAAANAGNVMPPRSVVPPVLITRQNIDSPEVSLITRSSR